MRKQFVSNGTIYRPTCRHISVCHADAADTAIFERIAARPWSFSVQSYPNSMDLFFSRLVGKGDHSIDVSINLALWSDRPRSYRWRVAADRDGSNLDVSSNHSGEGQSLRVVFDAAMACVERIKSLPVLSDEPDSELVHGPADVAFDRELAAQGIDPQKFHRDRERQFGSVGQ